MQKYILAIDQGTTNSRAIIFDEDGSLVGHHELAVQHSFPQNGWVEQDAMEMVNNTIACCRNVMKKTGLSAKLIAAIGITNQRETTILWDKKTGQPVYPAIVWQDRRTESYCKEIKSKPLAADITKRTGLLIDPYFSATKVMWLLDNVDGLRDRAEKNEILFGTVDTFILWHLTNGRSHATDITNASRTMFFNIHEQQWDQTILSALNIPANVLPEVKDNAADFGETDASLFGVPLPICGMAGDQQAATIGQACFEPGMVKATFGTGCFVVLNTGGKVVESQSRMLSTVAYRLDGKITYALEGSIFSAGTTIKWLRDTLGLIQTAAETETLARRIGDTGGVYLVPAFTGLGAPHWDPAARAALLGLTRHSGKAEIARAALESVAYQVRDLLEAMQQDSGCKLETIRVDGGMAANGWLLQFLADMLEIEVQRPTCIETTALGAAYLAGLQVGLYQSQADITQKWQLSAQFKPSMQNNEREKLYSGWKKAIERVT